MRLRIWLGLGTSLLLAGCPGPTAVGVQGSGSAGGGGRGDRLQFLIQPSSAFTGVNISPTIQVAAVDTVSGLVDTTFTGVVTMALGTNPTGALLSGTITSSALSGIAFFSDLSVNLAGTYTLTANNTNLGSVTSVSFAISNPP